jgi:hypothetical protein
MKESLFYFKRILKKVFFPFTSALLTKRSFFVSLIILNISFLLSGCLNDQVQETTIYFNDFEHGLDGTTPTKSTSYFQNGRIENYNGSKVLGRYGFDGLFLNLDSIPPFDMIEVSFDLFIHDNWEGNGNSDNNNEPDIWIFNIDGQNIVYSTFVNTLCQTQDCNTQQSFPNRLGSINPENADALKTNLPGACQFDSVLGGTKQYRYSKKFNLSGSAVEFFIAAQLSGVTSTDYCLKSWSIDNFKVTGITIPEIL